MKDFFNKCDQICSFLRIWSHLLKKSLMENFIFCAVIIIWLCVILSKVNISHIENLLDLCPSIYPRLLTVVIEVFFNVYIEGHSVINYRQGEVFETILD